MEQLRRSFLIKVVMVFLLAMPLSSITVNPALCPTNKIAPHRRIASWERPNGRTFAAYYDLLSPNTNGSPTRPQHSPTRPQYSPSRPQYSPPGPQYTPTRPQYSQTRPQYLPSRPQVQASLQEEPQADQPDDCGDIEDYDENDLSSVTSQNQNRHERSDQRWFFGLLGNRPPQQLPAYKPPTTTSTTPNVPQHSHQYPQRPPYWSGGLLSNNYYKPPSDQYPSDNLKPVHEVSDVSEVQQTYRPDVVGGPLNQVVGHTRPPTTPTPDERIRRRLEYVDNLRRQSTQATYTATRRPRPRKLNDNTVIGSFFDLFFK